MSELTRRQRSIYEFIVRQVRREGIPPTLMEIADAFGLSSAAGISDHLKAIERKGYIRRRPGASRGIELAREATPNPARRSVAVPILGDVPSGRGLSTGRRAGRLFVDSRLERGRLFAVRARQPYPERGVMPGDLLVASEQAGGDGLAIGTQGRRVLLMEMEDDGRRARAVLGTVDRNDDIDLRGRLVAVVRCFEDLESRGRNR